MIRALRVGFVAAALALALPGLSGAEVHYFAKQYTRCSACHYSESGGSLLTPYGRSLSREEISTFGASDPESEVPGREHQSLFGFVRSLGLQNEDGEGLDLGAVLRPSRIEFDFGEFSDHRDLWMRAEVQAAYRKGAWTAYGEFGRFPSDPPEFISREHWVQWQGDEGFGVKVGRFLPAFGIRHQDHTAYTRRDIGFDSDDQVYGLELIDAGDTYLVQFSVGPGRAESIVDNDGADSFTATGRLQMDLPNNHILALSGLYRGATDNAEQHWIGSVAHGWSPHPRLALWTELDTVATKGWKGTPQYLIMHETSFEVYKGLWLKFSPQLRTELANISGGTTRVGLGVQFFPRTHWNFNLTWARESDRVRDFTVKTLVLQLQMYL